MEDVQLSKLLLAIFFCLGLNSKHFKSAQGCKKFPIGLTQRQFFVYKSFYCEQCNWVILQMGVMLLVCLCVWFRVWGECLGHVLHAFRNI